MRPCFPSGKSIESKERLIVVRPFTFPDFTIDRTWPWTVASLKRTGSMAVAVNLSPARDSLLDSVSFKRTFRFVPTGTSPAGARGAVLRSLGLVVCALAMMGSVIRTNRTLNATFRAVCIESSTRVFGFSVDQGVTRGMKARQVGEYRRPGAWTRRRLLSSWLLLQFQVHHPCQMIFGGGRSHPTRRYKLRGSRA